MIPEITVYRALVAYFTAASIVGVYIVARLLSEMPTTRLATVTVGAAALTAVVAAIESRREQEAEVTR